MLLSSSVTLKLIRYGRVCYLESNESIYEGDPILNSTVLASNQSSVKRVDLHDSTPDSKRI